SCVMLVGTGGFGHLTMFLQTATYVYLFVIGILVALHVEEIRALLSSLSNLALGALWTLGLGGLVIGPAATSYVDNVADGLLMMIDGFASALIIALCISSERAERLLMRPLPQFLGRISYSLYLTHAIVITALVHAVAGSLPLAV